MQILLVDKNYAMNINAGRRSHIQEWNQPSQHLLRQNINYSGGILQIACLDFLILKKSKMNKKYIFFSAVWLTQLMKKLKKIRKTHTQKTVTVNV